MTYMPGNQFSQTHTADFLPYDGKNKGKLKFVVLKRMEKPGVIHLYCRWYWKETICDLFKFLIAVDNTFFLVIGKRICKRLDISVYETVKFQHKTLWKFVFPVLEYKTEVFNPNFLEYNDLEIIVGTYDIKETL